MASSERTSGPGLDTSVVLRLLVGEPSDQAEAALRYLRDLFSSGRSATVSDLVVAEAYFALHAHYEVPKRRAIAALRELLRSELVSPEPGGSALATLEAMEDASGKPGFVDRLIHAQYARKCGAMVTFEKATRRLEGVTVLGT